MIPIILILILLNVFQLSLETPIAVAFSVLDLFKLRAGSTILWISAPCVN